MSALRAKVSAFVVSFNRPAVIGTCLRALRFADEVIVVDKSSTDDTPAIATRHADRVVTVPWSPTVEGTRAFAVTQCTHDWIVFADDDECFSPQAVKFIQQELTAPLADVYSFPLRHYILGTHDERAYYWPEHHIRLFRRGAVEFNATVHAGVVPHSDRTLVVAADTGACIHHLSHQDVAQWIEKTNRYTSYGDRTRVAHAGADLIGFAHARIDHWVGRTRDATPGSYATAVALLRTTYDLIDRLKVWEEERGLDGAALFRQVCAELDAAYGATPPAAHDRPPAACAGVCSTATPPVEAAPSAEAILRASLHDLRAHHEVQQNKLAQELADARAALRTIESSTFWRATAWPRRVAGRLCAQR
jgi:O-antigen biosynthesis protein